MCLQAAREVMLPAPTPKAEQGATLAMAEQEVGRTAAKNQQQKTAAGHTSSSCCCFLPY